MDLCRGIIFYRFRSSNSVAIKCLSSKLVCSSFISSCFIVFLLQCLEKFGPQVHLLFFFYSIFGNRSGYALNVVSRGILQHLQVFGERPAKNFIIKAVVDEETFIFGLRLNVLAIVSSFLIKN